jgi:hypothetical protein
MKNKKSQCSFCGNGKLELVTSNVFGFAWIKQSRRRMLGWDLNTLSVSGLAMTTICGQWPSGHGKGRDGSLGDHGEEWRDYEWKRQKVNVRLMSCPPARQNNERQK